MQRMTKQRRMLLDELLATKRHPSADELHAIVRRQLPQISLGTVYRNLDVLVRSGIVRKLEHHGTQSRFDADLSDHLHVRCVECGQVEDLPDEPLPDLMLPEAPGGRFQVTGYQLEFKGLCPACAHEGTPSQGS